MDGPVAIVSIGATALVAILVPVLSARLERTKLTEQLHRERLEELRSVLDGAALALSHASAMMRRAEEAIEHSQEASADSSARELSEAVLAGVIAALGDVAEQRVRTAIRLGPGAELAIEYTSAEDALNDQLAILQSAFLGGPSSDEAGWKEVVRPLALARRDFDTHWNLFSEAASALIGPSSKA